VYEKKLLGAITQVCRDPVCILLLSCLQLLAAKIISAVYGLVMMAVLVGIMLQIDEDGPFAPSSLFFFVVAAEMIIAAFLHPQEFFCLPAGVVYYVTVPSMYLLLIVYSIFNLNVVSWGTRETVEKKSKMVRKVL
jgi:chitin synthase